MTDAMPLIRALRDPASVATLDAAGWTALIATARAEQIVGTLAHRVAGLDLPEPVARLMADARASAAQQQVAALWEAEMARRALAGICPVILLKGTAYAAAGLSAGIGRSIGDLDILVPRDRLDAAEAALLAAGWEWVKPDPYDDDYYRRWMHELPPLIHQARDRMIDVHHTILPLTARVTPDAGAMVRDAVKLLPGTGRGTAGEAGGGGAGDPLGALPLPLHHAAHGPTPRSGEELLVLSPPDMLLHNVAHLFADGDLSGGLRNLWDFDRLVRDFASDAFWAALAERAALHHLRGYLARALRLSHRLFDTPIDPALAGAARIADGAYIARITARDGWGRGIRKANRFAFYARSHWIRMPLAMLARHLWTKWRKA